MLRTETTALQCGEEEPSGIGEKRISQNHGVTIFPYRREAARVASRRGK